MRVLALFLGITCFIKSLESKIDLKIREFDLPTCFGQPMNNFVLDQFVEVKDQGKEGTCYSYAATANIEAALYRQTGNRRSLSREYATVSHCLRPEKRNSDGILERTYSPNSDGGYSSFFDGGYHLDNIRSLLDQERAPWDLPPNKKAEAQKYYSELKFKIEKLSNDTRIKTFPLVARQNELNAKKEELETEKKQIESFARTHREITSETKEFNIYLKRYEEIRDHLKMIDIESDSNNRELEEITTPNGKDICRNGFCYLEKIKGNTETANLRDLELNVDTKSNLVDQKSSDTLFDDPFKDPDQKCNSLSNSKVTRRIMRNLCIGVPVAASVMNTKIQTKNRSTKNSKKRFVPAHSMVITGVKTINGTPHFVFRNSWGKDAEETTLSFLEACKIKQTGSVLNTAPLKGESMSEAQAWINSGTSKPDSPDKQSSYEFFRSRQGKFIKYTDKQSFADEQAPKEQSTHEGLGPLPFKPTKRR